MIPKYKEPLCQDKEHPCVSCKHFHSGIIFSFCNKYSSYINQLGTCPSWEKKYGD